jgi:hypothetical protein
LVEVLSFSAAVWEDTVDPLAEKLEILMLLARAINQR